MIPIGKGQKVHVKKYSHQPLADGGHETTKIFNYAAMFIAFGQAGEGEYTGTVEIYPVAIVQKVTGEIEYVEASLVQVVR